MVDEEDLGLVAGIVDDEDPLGILRAQPQRFGADARGASAVDQRFVGVAAGDVALADDDLGVPITVQIVDRDVAGLQRLQG